MNLTIVIIAHNEAANLAILLPQLTWATRVLVIDNNSTDETKEIVLAHHDQYYFCQSDNFAQVRNEALALVKDGWLFYLDADERVTGTLRDEISCFLHNFDPTMTNISALTLQRKNYCFGYHLANGGWNKDWVTRIFYRPQLQSWTGTIHESPQYQGEAKLLTTPLFHLTHRNTAANLAKSSRWTIKEAALLAASDLPPVTKLTIGRKIMAEFYRRYYRDHGYRDGMAGFVESLTQAWNRGFVYVQVWELQQRPAIEERYRQVEAKVNQSLSKKSKEC